MDPEAILAMFDAEMREDPPPEYGLRVERRRNLTLLTGDGSTVIHAELSPAEAASAVAALADEFRHRREKVEWKLYGHDRPPELGVLLAAVGFEPDPTETVMAFDLAAPTSSPSAHDGVAVREVTSREELAVAAGVSEAAFGRDAGWRETEYAARLGHPGFAVFLATVDGVPASSGRLEMPGGRSFASLWGGGTDPRYRGRGLYRRLVAARAERARAAGFRYLTVDALPTSRPTLERLGFVPLTTATGWVLRA